ncbi:hypothetical protein NDA11_007801 [Ustilago hordei]|nr:hypothetical protein NDA10_008113 [Ustilago hordei]KAJ1577098.1 hypothetical protein NDA15_007243 [Ustilago hordei]KAJ1578524.1 hypothetical protein NDA12_001219 [Ustilago hordei]KAJ1584252.1 hypothetical protein NDA11_007801 [Ustilago hordei]UTT91186.1 hypothetical protein NDA17_002000 [Ustilago hordei]
MKFIHALALVSALPLLVPAEELDRRDGSRIMLSTTQFDPAITKQGGTTNAAGTFNVSPLAISTSYQFQTLSQTSTFQVGPVATAASGGSGGSGGLGGESAGGGTVVVTATAPTTTLAMPPNTGSWRATQVATATNRLPSLALGSTNNAVSMPADSRAICLATVALLAASMIGASNVLV